MQRPIHLRHAPSRLATSALVITALTLGCTATGAPTASQAPSAQLDAARAGRQILVTVEFKSSWRLPRAGTSGRWPAEGYRPSARTRRVSSDLATAYNLREVSSWPIRVLGIHCIVFEIPHAEDIDHIVDQLENDARVESAQPMNVFETSSSTYNDPYLHLQHAARSMQIQEAHRWARGVGVEIAVVDTGVDIEHPELRDRIQLSRDFVENDGRIPSPDLHGTAVTGVIVSAVDNDFGIIGVAPGSQILALKACWQETPGSALGTCSSFTLAKALTFAIERRPNILNLSLAGPSDPLLERLIWAAIDSDIVVVAAASESASRPFPSHLDGVLGVRSAQLRGIAMAVGHIDRNLVAPGVDIVTTSPDGGFDFHSGHSLATAHVSGVVALLLEREPDLTAAELYALLLDTSVSAERPDGKTPVMVNACAALAQLMPGPSCLPED